MERYLYLTLTPEALISSMLPPHEFGNYLAVGTKKRTRGQAIFFEIDFAKAKDKLPVEYIEKRCVPHKDGKPKSSVYLSIYRVLETLPLDAFKSLYLTTDDGRVLELKQADYKVTNDKGLHLYQELCPVTPRVVSSIAPIEFMKYMTSTVEQISLPKLVFVELQLNELAANPESGSVNDLPYENVDHLRDCLLDLKKDPSKNKKTVIRFFNRDLLFRTIKNGVFLGNSEKVIFYAFPSLAELEDKYYAWWRSAKSIGF